MEKGRDNIIRWKAKVIAETGFEIVHNVKARKICCGLKYENIRKEKKEGERICYSL